MGLHCVVQHRLGPILALDDHVRLRQPALGVTALIAPRLFGERLPAHGFFRIDQWVEHLPLDLDQPERSLSLVGAFGGDRRHGRALERRLSLEHVAVVRADRTPHPGRLARFRQVYRLHARARVRRTQDGCVQHAG